MASKSGTSKTPTGRKTPQTFSHVRPPSPKVDLTASKSKSAPSPKPKSEYLRSKGKSPSNIHHERSFNNGHNNDDCEYSVRSVFDENQLAKIKVAVDQTRLNVIDAAADDRNHFHAVPHKYDSENDFGYGEFGDYIEPTPRAMVSSSNDDCAVSDITADAPYMAQPTKYNNTFANNLLIEADDLASLSNDALESFARMIIEEKAKRSRMQGTPVVPSGSTPVESSSSKQISANDIHNTPVPEAVNARKNMGRARSGGNEQMIRKSRGSPSHQTSYFPSFRTYRNNQGINEDFGDVPMGNVELTDVNPSKSVDGVDGEVERTLRGVLLNSTGQPIMSVTPTTMPSGIASTSAHHPISNAGTTAAAAAASSSSSSAMPTLSPAGVTSHPLSRGASLSGRGSGTYVAIDRMCHDSSFTSPLHYVESPTHAAGNVVPPSATHTSSRPAPRINNLMDPNEEMNAAAAAASAGPRPASGSKPAKKLESFREAKQYSDSQIDVTVVEDFQPLGMTAQKETSKSVVANTLTTAPVRPIILTRTTSIASAGSDVSQEGLDSKTMAVMVEFDTLLKRDAAENATRRNRDLLVSPLCAFDDCASMESGWSYKSGGSRRSSTSHHKHVVKGATSHKDKHSSSHSHKNVSNMHYTISTSSSLAKTAK